MENRCPRAQKRKKLACAVLLAGWDADAVVAAEGVATLHLLSERSDIKGRLRGLDGVVGVLKRRRDAGDELAGAALENLELGAPASRR